MTRSHNGKSLHLEVRRRAEAEEFGLVEVGLEQGLGDIRPQRAERRLPNDAESGREAHLGAVEDEAALFGNGG